MPDRFKPGSRHRLLVRVGNEGADGSLERGAEATVRGRVPASYPGAHNDQEDAVVFEFDHSDRGDSPQAVSFNESQASEWFEGA